MRYEIIIKPAAEKGLDNIPALPVGASSMPWKCFGRTPVPVAQRSLLAARKTFGEFASATIAWCTKSAMTV